MNCHGMEEVDMKPKRIKPGWLTQEKIDRGPLPPVSRRCASWREALEYLDGTPGLLLTLIVLAVFVVGAYAIYSLWGMGEIYRAVAFGLVADEEGK